MPPRLSLVGQKFGRLLVFEDMGNNHRGSSLWRCLCDCGNNYVGTGTLLTTGHTGSCGCLHRESISEKMTTHGHSKNGKCSRTYNCWKDMKRRCSAEKDSHYHLYGGRGISVCERWKNSFQNFLDDMGECFETLTLDRIDTDGDYTPENCRWATVEVQSNNKRTNRRISFNGYVLTMKQWSDRIGIHYDALRARLDRGWPIELALTTPSRRY